MNYYTTRAFVLKKEIAEEKIMSIIFLLKISENKFKS